MSLSLTLDLQDNLRNSIDLLNILGAETRVRILQLISNGNKEFTIKDLAANMNVGISNVSQQVQKLVNAGLVAKVRVKETNEKLIRPLYKTISVVL